MRVTVHLLPTRKETRTVEVDDGATVSSVARALGLMPDAWVAVRMGEPVPTDEPLTDGDELELYSAVSGG